ATPASSIGRYGIVPILSDGGTGKLSNYTMSVTNGSLTILPAPLTVTAFNAGRTYGTTNQVLTGDFSGLQNGDNITAGFNTAATAKTPLGSYPITPVLNDPNGKLSNYAVTLNNGTLTITPAPL